MGKILDTARELRNYLSYEGLLIAHQHEHNIITPKLKESTELLRKACEKIVPQVIKMFKEFIENSDQRDYWYSYLNWKANTHSNASNPVQGLRYIEESLSVGVLEKIKTWLSPLSVELEHVNNEKAKEVLNNIRVEEFLEKKELIGKFEKYISELSNELSKLI